MSGERGTQKAEILERYGSTKSCIFPERTILKPCLASSVKAGFTLGMEKQMGCLWAMGYMWEVKGCCWELYATAIVRQMFFNLSCSLSKTSLFLVFINPPTNAATLRKLHSNCLSDSCTHKYTICFCIAANQDWSTQRNDKHTCSVHVCRIFLNISTFFWNLKNEH